MKNLIASLIVLTGLSAHAGIMIEPFLGYASGKVSVTQTSGTDASSKSTGTGYGARIGYEFPMGLLLAGEYAGGSGTITYNAGGTDDKYSDTAISAIVGYSHGMFRGWAGYGFTDEATNKASTGDTVFKGSNFKVGVGVMPMHHLSINFEYIIQKYTKYTSAGTDTDVSTSFSKFDPTTMLISVSAPFEFGGK